MSTSLKIKSALTPALLCLLLVMSNLAQAADVEETRDKIRAQSSEVLERLYAVQPPRTSRRAKGYAPCVVA